MGCLPLNVGNCSENRFPMAEVSGLQKGPEERGHGKKRQKSSKSVKKFSTLFDNFRAGQTTSKIVEKCQKVFRHFSTIFAQGKQRQKSSKSVKSFSTLFDNFRAAQKTSKSVKNIFDTFRHFRSRHQFSGPFLGGFPMAEVMRCTSKSCSEKAPEFGELLREFGEINWEEQSMDQCQCSGTKNQPKRGVFGTDIPRTSGGHSRGGPGPKLRSGRSKSWKKNKHLGADIHDTKARTSTTLSDFQKLRSENLWAEFSFPKCRRKL